jgi:hypothetical protein
MYSTSIRCDSQLDSRLFRFLIAWSTAMAVVSMAGCGGTAVIQPPDSTLAGNTSVTVLSSSTANDQLQLFFLGLNGVTLTNDAGKSITLFNTPQYAEFIHVNGGAEPLTTVSVPQGVYTSAAVSVGGGDFICASLDSAGDISTSEFGDGQVPQSGVAASLPEPITITGATMGLLLNLNVPKSASWTTCNPYNGIQPYSITPAFDITAVDFSAQPTSSANGMFTGLRGLVGSVDSTTGTGFSVTSARIPLWEESPSGPTWQVSTSASTVYQGITGFSGLAVGMPVDMDVAIQPDGSLLAVRIAVYDPSAVDLSISTGPLLSMWGPNQNMWLDSYEQGYLPGASGAAPFSFENALFKTSEQLANIQDLPFTASFTASNMVPGQNVFISTHALSPGQAPLWIPATTITLLPQSINGTVNAVGADSGFTTYTITLASYDLFPDLAVQPGMTTLLTYPNTVVVYADSNTQMLNSKPVAVGSVARFYGLVFNDNGTLRMDCAQINDGVAE